MSDIAIKIENLKKQYTLGAIGGRTLNAELQSWWARKCGKEDPNLKLGQDYADFGESFYALNGINLEIKQGEAVGIIGGNGAGKSTMLKILSRVTAPTEGDVWINGRIASMLEVGTGFHGELTGRENIYMNGAILGMTKKEVDQKMESIIDFSECRQFIDTPVKRYSSGMYVKLAFAVASHLDAEIMIMDEVLAVGDMAFQKKCLGKMSDEAHGGKTVLYVSHNMATIRNLCTRCIVLDKGRMIFDGEVEKAIDVYMNGVASDLRINYNFDGKKRSALERGTKIYIHDFSFVGKKIAKYFSSEKMKFCLKIEGKEDITDLRIRLEIRTIDGTNVGMSESLPLINIRKGETLVERYCFDIANLAEGSYTLRLTLFELNDLGYHKGLDETTELIYFDVVEDDNNRTNWLPQYWGQVKLPSVVKI
ncbi:ABC transporter ATP-binding protein [Selenomonas caprae]|uniref:ABC transporter ATP-binding protein n=1 Tax=Selenomonas caprae TaxID=2606905 RepID=A0A5D6WR76_9FIRM|nr:ABC transporter ATP-binding protein [Selenomonas caprae]TYZ29822.1 ABC transporter ATP-binding protein [Selenomonas caprae]